jgi:hypothetical protein
MLVLSLSTPQYELDAFRNVPSEYVATVPGPRSVRPGKAKAVFTAHYTSRQKLVGLKVSIRQYHTSAGCMEYQRSFPDRFTAPPKGSQNPSPTGFGETPTGSPIGEFQMCNGGPTNGGWSMIIQASVGPTVVEASLDAITRTENGVKRRASPSWPQDCYAVETLVRRMLSHLLSKGAPTPDASATTFKLGGVTFESADGWAKAHAYTHRYDKNAETVTLSKGKERIVIPLATDRAWADGKWRKLSHCTIKVGTRLWMPRGDLDKAGAG